MILKGYRTLVLSIFHLLSNINRFNYSGQSTGKAHTYLFTSFLLCFNYFVLLSKLGDNFGMELLNEFSMVAGGLVIFFVNYGILYKMKQFDKAFGEYKSKGIPLYIHLLTFLYISLTVVLLFL